LFEGRAAKGYDHGYDAEVFYLGLALDPAYVEGFIEGCSERIGEENPFRDLWEDEGERETVLEALQADCEVRPGRPPGY
jgi:vacuolar-type H+-ATPase subunit C/Vma6